MRLLLLEDDLMIGEAVLDLLRAEHYAVDWVKDGEAAETALRTQSLRLVLLDLGVPRRDGIEVLRALRARKQRMPVLIATARDAVQHRIEAWTRAPTTTCSSPRHGRAAGPHPCLAAPRGGPRRAGVEHTGVSIRPGHRGRPRVGGQAVVLSAREWAVLEPLIARPGMMLSRAQLEEELYGWKDEISSNAVEVNIHGLRKKLGAEVISNVRGVGCMVSKE